jgi:SAM-dependent methyltransferase
LGGTPRRGDKRESRAQQFAFPLFGEQMATFARPIYGLAKKLAFRYTRLGVPDYPYIVEPIELATLVSELDRVRDLPGSILEVGVAWGQTTRFVCEHLVASGRSSEQYCAIDTFDSFCPRDVEFEVNHRGKTREEVSGFGYIDFEVWKRNFREFKFLTAFKADCSTFDYSLVAPIKLAFLDVDLYLATLSALKLIYRNLVHGGVILVDDVMEPSRWDGANQAYNEFCEESGLPVQLIGNKMGIIRK